MPDGTPPPDVRKVSLFRNGRNQAVRIPRDMELPGNEAVITREGDRLVIEKVPRDLTLLEVREALRRMPPVPDGEHDPFDVDDPPPKPVEL